MTKCKKCGVMLLKIESVWREQFGGALEPKRLTRPAEGNVQFPGDFWTVRIGYPAELGRYFVHKGSIAVEGISLTIVALSDDHFDIAVIPKTLEITNLSSLNPGSAVNLESDIIAKYVERMVAVGRAVSPDRTAKQKMKQRMEERHQRIQKKKADGTKPVEY
jgi:hypothetical protein